MERTIKLRGELGKKFGRVHKAYVESVGEALRYLCANFPEFRHYIETKKIAGYEVWDGNYNLKATEEDFAKQGDGVIEIIPRVKASGAAARIIAGAILIVVGVFTSWLGPVGPYAIQLGIALVVGGVIELLSPKPKIGGDDLGDENASNSYIFSGAYNSTKQGNPNPIGYGRMVVGSQIISASITTSNIPVG